MRIATCLLLCLVSIAFAGGEPNADARPTDVWILSGQSNMRGSASAIRDALRQLSAKHGREAQFVESAQNGKPIEAWLDDLHPAHSVWTNLTAGVQDVSDCRGFVWYQGESDCDESARGYRKQFVELIRRVRSAAKDERMPVVAVQLATSAADRGSGWETGIVREAQRAVAANDPHVAVVSALDAPLKDLTVHVTREGSKMIATRVAAALDHLTFGTSNAHWGPQFRSVRFADADRRRVLISFGRVDRKLRLGDTPMNGFSATDAVPVDQETTVSEWPSLHTSVVRPTSAAVLSDDSILLEFAQPLAESARLSYAAERNAQ